MAGGFWYLLKSAVQKRPPPNHNAPQIFLQCRKFTFNLVNIMLDNSILLREMKLRCPHIKCCPFFGQIDLAGCTRIYLVQTDSGSLCKFFKTDACALQTAKHPHCFVLYGHFLPPFLLFALYLYFGYTFTRGTQKEQISF